MTAYYKFLQFLSSSAADTSVTISTSTRITSIGIGASGLFRASGVETQRQAPGAKELNRDIL